MFMRLNKSNSILVTFNAKNTSGLSAILNGGLTMNNNR